VISPEAEKKVFSEKLTRNSPFPERLSGGGGSIAGGVNLWEGVIQHRGGDIRRQGSGDDKKGKCSGWSSSFSHKKGSRDLVTMVQGGGTFIRGGLSNLKGCGRGKRPYDSLGRGATILDSRGIKKACVTDHIKWAYSYQPGQAEKN